MSEIEELRRENRELREELAEWRQSQKEDSLFDPNSLDTVARWAWAFGLSPAEVKIVIALVVTGGRIVSNDDLYEAMNSRDNTGNFKLLHVYICRAKRALAKAGYPDTIRNEYGRGYFINKPVSEEIIRHVQGWQ